jgi:hypothetical protein
MNPGPTLYYNCPECGMTHASESLLSGNTFGAKHYSDLRRECPMLPEFPKFVKCERCANFFWLEEQFKVKTYSNDSPPFVKFPSIQEYKEALISKEYRNDLEEKFIRIRLLWSYHRAVEEDKLTPEAIHKDTYYTVNIDHLIQLFAPESPDSNLFLSELNRFAGRFSDALLLLEPYADDAENPIAATLISKCQENNRAPFQLN